MRAYLRAFGWPLGSLFLLLTAAWIAGLIILPQLSMLERAFVFVDRGDDLSGVRTELNRASQEVALAALDLRTLDERRAALAEGGGAGGAAPGLPSPSLPSPSLPSPSLPSPSVSTPGLPSPGLPSPGLPSPRVATPGVPAIGVPTISGGTAAPTAETAEAIDAKIAALKERTRTVEARMAELRAEEARLVEEKANAPRYSLKNFATMSDVHLKIFLSTLVYATLVTVLSFVICYPVAYAAAMSKSSTRAALFLLALVVPYTINELLRIFAWVMILEREGVLNSILSTLGLFDVGEGPRWVASNWAVFTVMVYAYILFMVFPLYNTLETLDRNQIDAARDLGASTIMLHRRVVMPHAKPGIAVGAIMVFMLSAGTIAAPEIVGRGLHPDWFSQVIYRRFFESSNWNQGAAYSLMLLVACILFVMLVMGLFRVSIRDIAK